MFHACLVLEDNDSDAALIITYLADEYPELVIERASSVAQAIPIVQAGALDVAIVDLGLPDAHGLSAVYALRQQAKTLPILVLTGSADPTIRPRIDRLPVTEYMDKGARLNPQELYACLRALHRAHVALQVSQQPGGSRETSVAGPRERPWWVAPVVTVASAILLAYFSWLTHEVLRISNEQHRRQTRIEAVEGLRETVIGHGWWLKQHEDRLQRLEQHVQRLEAPRTGGGP